LVNRCRRGTGSVLVIGAAAVVYRIQTDNGELVITTDDPDVEIVIKQNGNEVRIIDTKTNKEVRLDSGHYDLELKGNAKGLKLSLDKVTIRRGETQVAIVTYSPKIPVAGKAPAEAAKTKADLELAKLKLGNGQELVGDANPGETKAVRGTTVAERPELAGVVVRDKLIDFEIKNADGKVIFAGKVQDRVVRSNLEKTLDFSFCIRNTKPDLLGRIKVVRREGFGGWKTDMDYRVDGLGTIEPDSVNRAPNGAVSFSFGKSPVTAGAESRFCFVHTDATEFDAKAGSMVIIAEDGSKVTLPVAAPKVAAPSSGATKSPSTASKKVVATTPRVAPTLVSHIEWQDVEQGMQAHIYQTGISADGKSFFGAGDAGPTGTIRVFDVATGKQVQQMRPSNDAWFSNAAFVLGDRCRRQASFVGWP